MCCSVCFVLSLRITKSEDWSKPTLRHIKSFHCCAHPSLASMRSGHPHCLTTFQREHTTFQESRVYVYIGLTVRSTSLYQAPTEPQMCLSLLLPPVGPSSTAWKQTEKSNLFPTCSLFKRFIRCSSLRSFSSSWATVRPISVLCCMGFQVPLLTGTLCSRSFPYLNVLHSCPPPPP